MNIIQRPIKFSRISSVAEFQRELEKNHLKLPVSPNLSVLANSINIDGKEVPNSLAIHPLEGFDGTLDGRPSKLVFRRYRRYAAGGAGMIWFEACAVSEDGRCNPYQLWIKKDNVNDFKKLVDETDQTALKKYGYKPYKVLQLTHSGRTSKDIQWNPIPLTAFKNPYIDKFYTNLKVATDERIELLEEEMVEGAYLAAEAGFDAVDIKICHSYIMRELLAAYTRPGKYGGSFENRTRFLFHVVQKIRKLLGNQIHICVRMNAYDCIPYPYGWGMKPVEGVWEADPTEPIRLIKLLFEHGVKLFNISTMMPRYQPTDTGYLDSYENKANLNPYESTQMLLETTYQFKKAVPNGIFVATGLSWFEQFGANIGAGGIEQGWFDIAGFGRQAFAYPNFATDILNNKKMERSKCCITCDKCYQLIDMHCFSGCVARDQEEYLPRYREAVRKIQESAEG